jgi:hypothetical protein
MFVGFLVNTGASVRTGAKRFLSPLMSAGPWTLSDAPGGSRVAYVLLTLDGRARGSNGIAAADWAVQKTGLSFIAALPVFARKPP